MTNRPKGEQSDDPLHVAARKVLLDALIALAPHGSAIIVAGAQAIYLRTGMGELAIAPYTTDGDIALDPSLLGDEPELEAAMEGAGFHLRVEPGIWVAPVRVSGEEIWIPVDLIVPEGIAPPGGRRGARLGSHGNRAARRILGLEACLVDHGPMTIPALDPGDRRVVRAEVAGPAALLIAKAHKLHDRTVGGRGQRVDDKDAADVVRIMQVFPAQEVRATLESLRSDPMAGSATITGLRYLDELFGRRGRPGIRLAIRALRLALPPERVEVLCVAFTSALVG